MPPLKAGRKHNTCSIATLLGLKGKFLPEGKVETSRSHVLVQSVKNGTGSFPFIGDFHAAPCVGCSTKDTLIRIVVRLPVPAMTYELL